MSSSVWLLRVESRDFSQAEKERTACKAQIREQMSVPDLQKIGILHHKKAELRILLQHSVCI